MLQTWGRKVTSNQKDIIRLSRETKKQKNTFKC